MTYPHRQRAPGFPLCLCGAMPGTGPTSTWGADCPAAMREHIATLTTTLRDLRAQIDYIARVGWDASCEAAAADALEAEDATRLNRYAVRVARERDEASAQLATTRRTLSALDCRYTGGGVADVSGSHCPLGAPCERCAGERGREEARESEPAPQVTTIYDVEGDL